MSNSSAEHRATSPQSVRCAVVTVSDTRTLETDTGGPNSVRTFTGGRPSAHGPRIFRRSRAYASRAAGARRARRRRRRAAHRRHRLSSRDQTFETVSALLTKPLPGYGEIFRMLSYQEIGPAGMLSRALAGLIERTVVFTMPGSPGGVRLAMERLIGPELGT